MIALLFNFINTVPRLKQEMCIFWLFFSAHYHRTKDIKPDGGYSLIPAVDFVSRDVFRPIRACAGVITYYRLQSTLALRTPRCYGHPAYTDTPLIRTAAKSPAKATDV